MKDKFCELLRSTKREGVEAVIENLESLGFFKAPASTVFHLNTEGGLVQHSLNVCDMALKLRQMMIATDPALADRLPEDSVIITALLHDVCKAEIYRQVLKTVKNEKTGEFEKVTKYEVDYSDYPIGHGEKSVIRLLEFGFKLTKDEKLAIRWHMSAWDLPFQSNEMKGNINAARNICPLLTILQSADSLASGIMEAK